MGGAPVALKVAGAGLGHKVVERPHGLHHVLLGLGTAYDLVGGEEVVRHGNQGVLGPAAEPIDGASADESRELECSVAELLANLAQNKDPHVSVYPDQACNKTKTYMYELQ